MQEGYLHYMFLILTILSICCTALLIAVVLGSKNKTQVHWYFIFTLISIEIWSIGAFYKLLMTNKEQFILPVELLNYVGVGLTGVSYLLFVLVFINTKLKLNWKYAFTLIGPMATAFFILTDPHYHLFFKKYSAFLPDAIFGPGFLIHASYAYSSILIGMIIFISYSIKNAGLFSKQALLMIAGSVIPVTVDILTTLNIIPGGCYITVSTLPIFVLCSFISIFKLGMLNVTPIAFRKVVDHMAGAFVIIDLDYNIVGFNASMKRIINNGCELKKSDKLENALKALKVDDYAIESIYAHIKSKSRQTVEFTHKYSDEAYFEVELIPLSGKEKVRGYILMFKDITEYVKTIQTIQEYKDIVERNVKQVSADKQQLLIRFALLEKAAKTDMLTNVYNHRTFQEYMDIIISNADNKKKVYLAIIDIDDFKQVNDTHGHAVGDAVLARIAKRIQLNLTSKDIVARYGGEEFVIIFTDTALEETYSLLDNIRIGIKNEKYREIKKPVTVSIGVTEYIFGESKQKFFDRADKALYEAKRTGKNKVVIAMSDRYIYNNEELTEALK